MGGESRRALGFLVRITIEKELSFTEREDWRRGRFLRWELGDEDLRVGAVLHLRYLRHISVEMPSR